MKIVCVLAVSVIITRLNERKERQTIRCNVFLELVELSEIGMIRSLEMAEKDREWSILEINPFFFFF